MLFLHFKLSMGCKLSDIHNMFLAHLSTKSICGIVGSFGIVRSFILYTTVSQYLLVKI